MYPHNTFPLIKRFCYGRVGYHSSNTSPVSVQVFSLGEDSGYLWKSFVYLRKNPGNDNESLELENRIGKTGIIVVLLAKDLFGLGYKLYVDIGIQVKL